MPRSLSCIDIAMTRSSKKSICYNGAPMERQHVSQHSTNLFTNLKSSLSSEALDLLQFVSRSARDMGAALFLVGGSVRDILLGVPVKDIDLVVEGDAARLAILLARETGSELPVLSQFGTAMVKLRGLRLDLATARKESYTSPGALPKVRHSTIQEDLKRRDFSINAIAIDLSTPRSGHLLDPLNGRDDLIQGLIRVLHPKSFIDDPTRILRAIRYENRLGFRLEGETHRLLTEATTSGMLDTLSGDRLRRELHLMFEERTPSLPLSRCGDLGVLSAIHPPLGNGRALSTLNEHGYGSHPFAYLAALSYPLSAPEGETLIQRLGMPTSWAKVVRDTILVRAHCSEDSPKSPYIGGSDITASQLSTTLDQFSIFGIEVNALMTDSAITKEALGHYLTTLRYVKPSLSGKDLLSMGVIQGPQVGKILRELKAAMIEGRVTNRQQEIRVAKGLISTEREWPDG